MSNYWKQSSNSIEMDNQVIFSIVNPNEISSIFTPPKKAVG